MLIPPRTALVTSIPIVITVISVPRVALSEKLKTIGEASVCITPRQKVISAPMTTRVRTPFLPASASPAGLQLGGKSETFLRFPARKPLFYNQCCDNRHKKSAYIKDSSRRIRKW